MAGSAHSSKGWRLPQSERLVARESPVLSQLLEQRRGDLLQCSVYHTCYGFAVGVALRSPRDKYVVAGFGFLEQGLRGAGQVECSVRPELLFAGSVVTSVARADVARFDIPEVEDHDAMTYPVNRFREVPLGECEVWRREGQPERGRMLQREEPLYVCKILYDRRHMGHFQRNVDA